MTEEQKASVLKSLGITVNGDFVMEKHVENEIGNVEAGGIGIQINHGQKNEAKTTKIRPKAQEGTKPVDDTFHYVGIKARDGQLRLVKLYQKLISNECKWLASDTSVEDWSALFMGVPAKAILKWTGTQTQLYGLFCTMMNRNLIKKISAYGKWEVVGGHFVDGNNKNKTFTNWNDLKVGKKDQRLIDVLVDYIDISKEMPVDNAYSFAMVETEDVPEEESCYIKGASRYNQKTHDDQY